MNNLLDNLSSGTVVEGSRRDLIVQTTVWLELLITNIAVHRLDRHVIEGVVRVGLRVLRVAHARV